MDSNEGGILTPVRWPCSVRTSVPMIPTYCNWSYLYMCSGPVINEHFWPVARSSRKTHTNWTRPGQGYWAGRVNNRGVHSCPFARPFSFPLSVLSVLSARNMFVPFTSFSNCPFTKENASNSLSKMCYSSSRGWNLLLHRLIPWLGYQRQNQHPARISLACIGK